MMLHPFRLHRPRTLDEALELRRSLGDEAVPYAGGTELLLAMKLGLTRWPHLIDVKHVAGLEGIRVEDGVLSIGARATHHQVACDPSVRRVLPRLSQLEGRIANVRVRVAGTLAGNLAFGEPHADPPILLTALNARLVLAGREGVRRMPTDDFLVGAYQTAIRPDELITAVEVPLPGPKMGVAYVNFRVLERPSLGVAVAGEVREGRFEAEPTVVVGAVDEVPRRLPALGLSGCGPDDHAAIDAAAEAARAAVRPVEDLAGSAAYKRHLVGVLTRRALLAALAGAAT